MVSLEDFPDDPYKHVRSASAKNIVGITMQVTYTVETPPTSRPYDSERFDGHGVDTYRYDLELDEFGRIIGGEWYENIHPDFLWTPFENSRAFGPGDEILARSSEPWAISNPLPPQWRNIAAKSSQYRLPLALVVEELIRASTQGSR